MQVGSSGLSATGRFLHIRAVPLIPNKDKVSPFSCGFSIWRAFSCIYSRFHCVIEKFSTFAGETAFGSNGRLCPFRTDFKPFYFIVFSSSSEVVI